MDLKKEFEIGKKVLCIKEDDLPDFVGKVWTIKRIEHDLIYCENFELFRSEAGICSSQFPFKADEVVLITPLIAELL